MRLTDILIRNLRPPATGQKTHFDEALPGFGVRVSQGGTKSFVVMYGPKRKLKTLGRYPDVSLADARKAAKLIQAEALAESAVPPRFEQVLFADARRRFLADSKARNKPRTYEGYCRLLHRHFAFEMNLDELTRADIMGAVEKLATTPSEQQHAFVAVRVMLNWCVKRGFLDHSPVPPLSFRTPARSNVLYDDDLRAVWNQAFETPYPYGPIVQLLILTGQRRGEIAALRRSWIEDDLVVLPADFTKNRREHRLPLSPWAQAIVEALPDIGDLLFPARGVDGRAFNGWGKCKERFDRPLSIAPYTLHDLRRTYSSNLARLGTPIHVAEKLLNHISGTVSGVAAIYNRYSYLDEMREAVRQHDEFLAQIVQK
ncbi:MAG: site-specific integrase [Azospirillaceae bacterium]